MSDNIDKIIDRLIKGGPGSGKRGHVSAPAPVNYDKHGNYRKEDHPHVAEKPTPVSDTSRELDPDKKKKTLASDRKAAKKEVKDHSPEELQSKIDSHKELSENKFLSPASRESYAAKHKALVSHQKKQMKSKDIKREPEKKEEGIASRPGPFGNINKGGPGSGRKGHKSEDGGFDTSHHEMMHGHMTEDLEDEDHDNEEDAKEFLVNNFRNKIDNNDWDEYSQVSHGGMEDLAGQAAKKHIGMKKSLIKGGPGSGRKGHKSEQTYMDVEDLVFDYAGRYPINDSNDLRNAIKASHPDVDEEHLNNAIDEFEIHNPNLQKGGPGSGKKGHMGVTPDRTQRERNRQKAGDALQTSKDAKRIIAELGLDREDLKELRDYASAEGITPSQFIVNNKERIKTNLKKGGPGSGKKGHKTSGAMTDNRKANTEKYLEQLKTSLSLERDPEAQKDFKKDIADIEKELKMNKSLETLFYMKQLANEGRIKPKQKRNMKKSLKDRLQKKQGVPKGVDPAKHERCVLDVKAEGKDKSSAYAICNSSMTKAEEVEKVLPLAAAAKTAGRIVQNAVKSPDAGKGSDKVPGGPGGPSAAAGGGTGSKTGSETPKIKKSFAERLDSMFKGGIGSGRKGHHSIGQDYSDASHDSVFEDSRYDSTQEREIFNDKIKEALDREADRADQRIREKESKAKRGISRKPKKEAPKKTLLQKLTQKIIDAI